MYYWNNKFKITDINCVFISYYNYIPASRDPVATPLQNIQAANAYTLPDRGINTVAVGQSTQTGRDQHSRCGTVNTHREGSTQSLWYSQHTQGGINTVAVGQSTHTGRDQHSSCGTVNTHREGSTQSL